MKTILRRLHRLENSWPIAETEATKRFRARLEAGLRRAAAMGLDAGQKPPEEDELVKRAHQNLRQAMGLAYE